MNKFSLNRVKEKISICSLAYNHANYLDDFFKGVLNQHTDHFTTEIIIGIDKCNDGTLEKCVEYKNKFPHIIKLIIHPERIGMMHNFVSVLSSADGEYIAFCECDDYWIDEYKLVAQLNLLSQDKNIGICFTDIKMLMHNVSLFEENWARITKKKYTLKDALKENVITNCSVLMKNNLDENMLNQLLQFRVGDWPLYILSMLKDECSAVYLEKITAVYRQHDGGSYSTKNTLQSLSVTNSVYLSLLDIVENGKVRKWINRELTENYYSLGVFQTDKSHARNNYKLAIKNCSTESVKYSLYAWLRLLKSYF